MKYIGNKTRLLSFIEESLKKAKIEYKGKIVVDLFAGTGSVSSFFLKNENEVFSCDNMFYSICEQYRINYFPSEPTFEELKDEVDDTSLDGVLNYLNNIEPIEGYFFDNVDLCK